MATPRPEYNRPGSQPGHWEITLKSVQQQRADDNVSLGKALADYDIAVTALHKATKARDAHADVVMAKGRSSAADEAESERLDLAYKRAFGEVERAKLVLREVKGRVAEEDEPLALRRQSRKRGLSAKFECVRISVFVTPLQEFVTQPDGVRWQRMEARKLHAEQFAFWVRVGASRADVEQMLENAEWGADPERFERPRFDSDMHQEHIPDLGAVDAPEDRDVQ